MNYQIFTEHPLLYAYVKDIWTVRSDALKTVSKNFQFFADGSPGIMFQQADVAMFMLMQLTTDEYLKRTHGLSY